MNQKTAVIVGAGPGVSAGVARKFGAEGFTVVLLARNPDSLARLAADLRSAGIEAHHLTADVTVPGDLQRAFDGIRADHGTPDVLVYNAGANTISDPSTLDPAGLVGDFAVNVLGALACAQLVVPGMKERGTGTILFTGGALALKPVPSRASASISKAGLRNLAFTLADELADDGLRVGTVTIGGVVKAGTFYDPDLIAAAYWDLHTGAASREVQYTEA